MMNLITRKDGWLKPLDVEGRDVLLVDDIFDTGHTLNEVITMIDELGPKSILSSGQKK